MEMQLDALDQADALPVMWNQDPNFLVVGDR